MEATIRYVYKVSIYGAVGLQKMLQKGWFVFKGSYRYVILAYMDVYYLEAYSGNPKMNSVAIHAGGMTVGFYFFYF
jgi:hypothetical protein